MFHLTSFTIKIFLTLVFFGVKILSVYLLFWYMIVCGLVLFLKLKRLTTIKELKGKKTSKLTKDYFFKFKVYILVFL